MRRSTKRVDHTGSTLDSLLEDDGILAEVEAVAMKRVLDWQRQQAAKTEKDKCVGRK
jgi:antitoxin HicB